MLKAAKKQPKEAILINLKVTPEEREQLQAKADEYTNGNVSMLLRYAALNFVAKKRELAG